MNLRKITSLTSLLSFLLLVTTSVVLYITPQGRVAYWADWRLWGLDKTQWGSLHINLGVLFLLSSLLHLYYNWKAVMAYLKDKAHNLKVFTPDFNVSLAVAALFVLGTFFSVPPFQWIITLNDTLKDQAAAKYGIPPYGHAELSSLEIFAGRTGLIPDEAVGRLREAGIRLENARQSLQDIAKANGLSPQQLHNLMKPEEIVGESGRKGLPPSPPPGFGRLTLKEIAGKYGLELAKIVNALKSKGLPASPDEAVKSMAERAGASPMDIYTVLREGTEP